MMRNNIAMHGQKRCLGEIMTTQTQKVRATTGCENMFIIFSITKMLMLNGFGVKMQMCETSVNNAEKLAWWQLHGKYRTPLIFSRTLGLSCDRDVRFGLVSSNMFFEDHSWWYFVLILHFFDVLKIKNNKQVFSLCFSTSFLLLCVVTNVQKSVSTLHSYTPKSL